MLNISTPWPTWARATRTITILLALCLLVAVLLLREPLTSAWYGNLGYLHLTRALLSSQPSGEDLARAEGFFTEAVERQEDNHSACLLYTSPSPRDRS